MKNETNRRRRSQASMWAAGLLAVAFLFCQPTGAQAQNNVTTPGGTINKIPKWNPTTTNSLIDSIIYDNGNVGINTTNPLTRTDIVKTYTNNGGSGTSCGEICWGVYQADMTLLLRSSNTSRTTNFGGGIGFTDSAGGFTYGAIKGAATNSTAGEYGGYLGFYTTGFNSGGGSNGYERMRIDQAGNVGIGTTNPQAKAHIYGVSGDVALRIESGTGATRLDLYSTTGGALDRNWTLRPDYYVWGDLVLFQSTSSGIDPVAGNARFYVRNDGNIGIGTTAPAAKLHVAGGDVSVTGAGSVSLTATGNITASGTIQGGIVIAKYQDVAEWVPANRAMPAGTVVTLDPEHSNLVVASSHSYDTRVAGVVSERPGVILGEKGEGKVMVATTGRVRVKVDATNGPLRVGDLLVTSDKEGIAMRSQPLDLGGTPIHRPGTLIGKALEPLEKGVGEILVLLSLQ